MIIYKIGNIDCKISWIDFLCLETTDNNKIYKSDFTDFAHLYEYIDYNIKKIKKLTFDNLEYTLKNGLLHNLYNESILKHTIESDAYFKGTSRKFYIHGKEVWNKNAPVKKLNDFLTGEIYHYEEITFKRTDYDSTPKYRRKEGIDYKKHYINLGDLMKKESRAKKLNKILE